MIFIEISKSIIVHTEKTEAKMKNSQPMVRSVNLSTNVSWKYLSNHQKIQPPME